MTPAIKASLEQVFEDAVPMLSVDCYFLVTILLGFLNVNCEYFPRFIQKGPSLAFPVYNNAPPAAEYACYVGAIEISLVQHLHLNGILQF